MRERWRVFGCLTFGLAAQLIASTAVIGSEYRLRAGDRLRITVADEADLSGEFDVDRLGFLAFLLIGPLPVMGLSVTRVKETLTTALKDGYLHAPRVEVEVINLRPVYVLGEVRRPGSYRYLDGLTVAQAIQLAGGTTDRASQGPWVLGRTDDLQRNERGATDETEVWPGDILRVPERFF